MKKCFITVFCILVNYFSFAQDNLKEYTTLKNVGDSLYKIKEYKNSALAYSAALKQAGANLTIWDFNRTAFSWALSGYPDSAFYQLNNIANSKDLTFDDINDILTDDDYASLLKDMRWQDVKKKMFLTAYKTFFEAQREIGGNVVKLNPNDLAFAVALGNNIDTAFYHLNDAAYFFLGKKIYNKAYDLFKLSISSFPTNFTLTQNMGDFYMATGEKGLAYVYYSRAQIIKYKQSANLSDPLLKIDSAIEAVYFNLSQRNGYTVLPPVHLVSIVANTLSKKGMVNKAYTLLQMNIKNYPNSFRSNNEMGDFYDKKGEKIKANEYYSKSLILEYQLPDKFFNPSFNSKEYIKLFYEKMSTLADHSVLPPELLVNKLGYIFLSKKYFDNAESLFKMNIENYPKSWNAFSSMSKYYEETDNKEKAKELHNQSVEIKNNSGTQSIPRILPVADTSYDTHVATPVCRINCPTILIDEAHNNYMKPSGLYKPFANLMANDGFQIIQNQTPFTRRSLAQIDVVVIATTGSIKSNETQSLNEWIRQGGSLLAITDHDNFAIDELLQSLGVQTKEINVTTDSLHCQLIPDGSSFWPGFMFFSEADKLLGNHPIIQGRNNSEKVRMVNTFGGRSIIGPPSSSILLKLSESAIDYMITDPAQPFLSRVPVKTKGLRSFGVAFNYGKGKVVVICEAGTLTAQLFRTQWKIGMNRPGSDNKQFALNIMRWLTGYLK